MVAGAKTRAVDANGLGAFRRQVERILKCREVLACGGQGERDRARAEGCIRAERQRRRVRQRPRRFTGPVPAVYISPLAVAPTVSSDTIREITKNKNPVVQWLFDILHKPFKARMDCGAVGLPQGDNDNSRMNRV